MQDPIFEPWSVGERKLSSREWSLPATHRRASPAPDDEGITEFLRAVAMPRLEAVSRRLRMARHWTACEDLLDEPAHLLRFQLTPWLGPLSEADPDTGAMLEIGVGGESDELVTAWYWLDCSGEAPHEVATVPREKLDAAWVERTVLDFVSKVLERR